MLEARKRDASDDAGMEMYVEQVSTHTSEKESIFDDVSIAQILAGALAAVTSMLFASQIGIAGSVIGVAVASVVATVSSQLYKKVLSKSADKIRDLRSSDDDAGADSPVTPYPGASEQGTALLDRSVAPVEGKTVCMDSAPAISQTPHIGDDDANIGDELLRRRAEKRRKQRLQRRVIAVSIGSALAAVALSVVFINVVTAGAGIGTKTAPIVSTASQSQVVDAAPESTGGSSSDSTASTEPTTPSKTDAQTAPSATGTTPDSSSSGSQTPTTSGTQGGSSTGNSATGGSSSSTGTGTGSSTGTSGTGTSSGTTGSGSSSDTTKSDQSSSSTSGSSGTTTSPATTSK